MTQVFRTQWDGLAGLVAATLLTILSVLDILPSDLVATATLGVLALVCFTMIRTAVDHDAMTDVISRLESSMAVLIENIRLIDGLKGVPHEKIGPALLRALARTKIWRFKGGTGTYLRAETLPLLALSRSRVMRRVWIEIIDPCDLDACQGYANYRTRMLDGTTQNEDEAWSCERVQIEAYATIVAALWYDTNHHMMVRISLSPTVSSFRYDLSSGFVMITNEERESTALRAKKRSTFYDRYAAELELSFEQARFVDLTKSSLGRQFGGTDVRRALRELLDRNVSEDFLTDETCDRIALKAISEGHASALGVPRGTARNPYS